MTIHHDSKADELPADVLRASRPVAGLEALTGADMAIFPPGVHLPDRLEDSLLCRAGFKAHLCYLVQYKRGLDLPSSVGPRLTASLAKMREWVPRPSQRVLLVRGVLTARGTRAMVNGRESRKDYWPVWSAQKKWCDRGGVVWPPVSRESLVLEALERAERHLAEYAANPIKEAWPKADGLTETDEDDPLQIPRVVKDARTMLAMLPGIGSQRANDVWKYCQKKGALALTILTDYAFLEMKDRPKGFGKRTVEKCREFLSIPDEYNLYLLHDLETPKEEKP